LEAAREGPFETHAPSYEEVYSACKDDVYRFCLLQTGNPARAEELAAEALFRAFRAYDRAPTDPARIQAWLFRIARNVVINDWRRRRNRDRLIQILGRTRTPDADAEAVAMRQQELAGVLTRLAQLKPRDRLILSLRFGSELTTRELAGVLGMSESSTTMALHRALQRFRKRTGSGQ
jgi:RNA polymerase sigma-70 factor (ECF subfamily)